MSPLAILIGALVSTLGGWIAARWLLARWPARWLRATPRGDLLSGDCFAVFGFGLCRDDQGNETAGVSNDALAKWLLVHNPNRKPTFVQEGVYLALRAIEAEWPNLSLDQWIFRLPHEPAAYATTGDATLQCWELATLRGLSRPVVVAHDLQLQRMVWMFEAAFGDDRAIVPEMPCIPFEPASIQHRGTRSRLGWIAWELLLARPAMGRFGAVFAFAAIAILGMVLAGGIAVGVLALTR